MSPMFYISKNKNKISCFKNIYRPTTIQSTITINCIIHIVWFLKAYFVMYYLHDNITQFLYEKNVLQFDNPNLTCFYYIIYFSRIQ